MRSTGHKIYRFVRSHIKRTKRFPSFITRHGINYATWREVQIHHELDFWQQPEKYEGLDGHSSFREKYFSINKNMFTDLRLDFPTGVVTDVGCGPEMGFLPYCNARYKIGIEPLAHEYHKKYAFDSNVVMLASMAERIPLMTASVDACYCINALDHMMKPYQALAEMYRILKPQGYFAFSVDVGGTKDHPIKIYQKDLDAFFTHARFDIIQQACSLDIASSWGVGTVPLYVFQGYKR